MGNGWYHDSETGTQNDKMNPLEILKDRIPGGFGSAGEDSIFVNVEQLITFASDILEMSGEFGDNVKRGVIAPMTGDGAGSPGAGFVPSSGLLHEGSIFADKYNYACQMVQEEFGKHLNGMLSINAAGVNAATGYLNGDQDGDRNLRKLLGDGVPEGKGMFTADGKPAEPPNSPKTKKAAAEAAELRANVNDILTAQKAEATPATDSGASHDPTGPALAGTPGYHTPKGDEVRGDVLAGGRAEHGGDVFDHVDGMIILRDDEGMEINRAHRD